MKELNEWMIGGNITCSLPDSLRLAEKSRVSVDRMICGEMHHDEFSDIEYFSDWVGNDSNRELGRVWMRDVNGIVFCFEQVIAYSVIPGWKTVDRNKPDLDMPPKVID